MTKGIHLHHRRARGLGALLLAALLAACGTQSFRQGNELIAAGKTEQGLALLESAVHEDPRNAEFRIALGAQRAAAVDRALTAGDAARRDGRLTEAEKAYRQAQSFDPQNAMARQGLDELANERRHRQLVADAGELVQKGGRQSLREAREKLRPVLLENPSDKEAHALQGRIDELLAQLQPPPSRLGAAFRKPISLEFRDAPLKSVLDVVAKVSGLNFYFDRDIRPDLKVTILAKDTTIEDALNLLLVTNQLEQRVLNQNSILVYPGTAQKLKDYQALEVRTFYLTNADVKAVSNSIKTLVKTKDLVVDERLGMIMMRDTPEAVRMAERIVNLQDMGDPEVMLEVEILEVKRSRLSELGVQWPTQLALTPLQLGTTPLTLNDLRHLNLGTVQATTGSITISAHNDDTDGNILANPRIRVRNKEKAKIQIGDRVPVITTTATSTGFVSESVNYIDVGLKLEVEPAIYLDQEVGIKINLEVSDIVKEVLSKAGTLSYQIGTRGANTVLRLKDGETQILAGLISNEDRASAVKVPALGDLPLAGRLFGSHSSNNERTEILLSITPHVVRSLRRPDLQVAEFDSGTETSVGATSLRLESPEATDDAKADAKPAPAGAKAAPTPASAPMPAAAASAAQATPATTPRAGPAAAAAPAAAGPAPLLSWQMPAQVHVGEMFSAVLRVSSQQPLRGLPLLIGFDPQQLQVASVQEGDFFKQSNGQTQFSQRVDPAQGKVFVALVRRGDAGVNGSGTLVTVAFKALKALKADALARVQLLSATPEPQPAAALALPVEQGLRVVP